MPREVEEPTITIGDSCIDKGDEIWNHPAYGAVALMRSSGHQVLFGSDFVHQYAIRLKIYANEVRRGKSGDNYYPGKTLAEVMLSESQWATLVSSVGAGAGVPCTLQYMNGQDLPALPNPVAPAKRFGKEADKAMAKALAGLKTLEADVEKMGLTKAKTAAITGPLHSMIASITSTLPFIADMFSEHMERTTDKAKQEIHAYMLAHLPRLSDGAAPLLQLGAEPQNKE